MPRTNPFTVTIYDKDLNFQQRLGSATSYSFTPRWGLGTGTVITRSDDPANQLLGKPGARLVVEYRGEVVMSGIVQQRTGSVLPDGTIAWDLFDDRYALAWTRARVQPAGNIAAGSLDDTAQQVPRAGGHSTGLADGSGYYAWPATPSAYSTETAVKQVIADNFARFTAAVLQGKIAIQTDQQRGGDARAAGKLPQLRFDTLQDGLGDLLEWANLGIRVWQTPNPIGTTGTVKLDVFQPRTFTQIIGGRNRIITDGSYQQKIPSLTRLVLGGPGEDAARVFYEALDQTGLEALYGVAIEGFSDATGATLKWPDGLDETLQVAAYYLQRGNVTDADKAALRSYFAQAAAAALAAGLPTSGLNVSLSETDSFHYGGDGSDGKTPGYHVGDRVTMQVENGPAITQRITEATLTFSNEGFSVAPKVGEITDDPTEQLAEAVAGIAAAVQRISTRT